MTFRVLVYARYSSDAQREASIDDQFRISRVRVEREGWQNVGEHHDAALSGATLSRPGYQALMADLRAGRADIVLAESLDRFSRDQEHVAAFYKLCVFAGVRIITLSDGEVGELHVGLRGTMGALYLKDLADKTRRGEEGRILKGRSFGSASYGYRVVHQLGADGELDRGLREIDPEQAEIVRRIFRDYASGTSPLAIARALNAEGIPGPAGGLWYHPSIRGRPTRGDGILRNALYAGRLVWNRRRNAIDPSDGAKLRRPNPAAVIIDVDVPLLRIVDDTLWRDAQARLVAEAVSPQAKPDAPKSGFWDRRRPKHLLTGKVQCGACGCTFSSVGGKYVACPGGHQGTCRNRSNIRRGTLEAAVVNALRGDLMHPDLMAGFIEAFNAESRRLTGEASSGQGAVRGELAATERKLANLVNALSEGYRGSSLQQQLDGLEARCRDLEGQLAAMPAVAPIAASEPDGDVSSQPGPS